MNLKNLVLSGLMAFYLSVVPASNSVVFADNTSSQDSSVKTELSSHGSLEDKVKAEAVKEANKITTPKEVDDFVIDYYFNKKYNFIRHLDFPKEAVGPMLAEALHYYNPE